MTNLVSQIENVVRWLKNGCDQQSAAVELQGIADEMRATRRWTPCLNKDGDAEMIEDPRGAFVLLSEVRAVEPRAGQPSLVVPPSHPAAGMPGVTVNRPLEVEPGGDSYRTVSTEDRILSQQELKNAWALLHGNAHAQGDVAGHMRALQSELTLEQQNHSATLREVARLQHEIDALRALNRTAEPK